LIEANWLAFLLALVIGLLVAWWLFARGSKGAEQRTRRPDVLDEGAEQAKRNQALIDAPSAAASARATITAPPQAGAMAGIGEVIAVAAQDEVEEVEAAQAEAAPPPEPAAGEGDDLSRIKGVGPKLVVLLQSLGITRFEQIAGWSEEDIDRIDAQLGAFAGRIRRDSWVEQAKFLAGGDTAGFEAKFGKL
jgi:predicted flap endonuclease-1-like 5' DNA nuclease